MILAHQGVLLLHKSDIRSAHFVHAYKGMLNQEELNALEQVLEQNQITNDKIEEENAEPKLPDTPSWDHEANLDIHPPLERYPTDQAETNNNIVGSWE